MIEKSRADGDAKPNPKAALLEPFQPETIAVGEYVKMASDPKIEYTNRQLKERQLQAMKTRFLEKIKEDITSARQAYTKVTEDKVRYRFGYNEIEFNNKRIPEYSLIDDKIEPKTSPQGAGTSQRFEPNISQIRLPLSPVKGKGQVRILKKDYDFKSITEFIYFNKESAKEDVTKQLKLKDIAKLNTEAEFQRDYQDYQLSSEILQLFRDINSQQDNPNQDRQILAGKRFLRTDRELIDQLDQFIMKPNCNTHCILFGNRSRRFDIDYLKHLVLNRKKEYDRMEYQPLDMPRTLANITCDELTFFAGGRYARKQIQKMEQLNNTKRMNIKLLEDEKQLDKRYAQLRAKIAELKKAKNISKNLIKSNQAAQTEKLVGDESLNELIDINTQRTLNKINDLLKVKDEVLESPIDYPQELRILMFEDVHRQMREQLFCLLMAIVKDESFVNYSEYFKGMSREVIEDKMLEVIYYNLDVINDKVTRSKESKVKLLNLYLNERKVIRDYENFLKQKNTTGPNNTLAQPKRLRSKSTTPKKKPFI